MFFKCVYLHIYLLEITTDVHVHCVQAELKSGNNVLYWRTTGYAIQGSAVKPVLLRNIGISGKLLPVSCAHQFKSFPLNYMLIGGFFSQGWPTHQSVFIVNLAPIAKTQDLLAVPPAPLIRTLTKGQLFVLSVTKINIQV